MQLNQVLKKKLKERDEQLEQFASLAKSPEDYDEIESAIKELQDSLENAKNEIAELSSENIKLREENDALKSEQNQTELKPEIEQKIMLLQADMFKKLCELEDSLSFALEDNKSLKSRLNNLQSQKEKQATERDTELKRLQISSDEEQRKLESQINLLQIKIQDLSSRDEQQRIMVSKLTQENSSMKEKYEQRLFEIERENSLRENTSQKPPQRDSEKPQNSIRGFSERVRLRQIHVHHSQSNEDRINKLRNRLSQSVKKNKALKEDHKKVGLELLKKVQGLEKAQKRDRMHNATAIAGKFMQVLSQRQLAAIPLKIQDQDTSSDDATLVKKKSSKRLKKAVKKIQICQDLSNIEKIKRVRVYQAS